MNYRLRIFEPDRTTVYREFSTEPAHARPYLHMPTQFAEQEIDLARGSASIGMANFALIDPPTVPGNQDTGYVTASLATPDGHSAWMGRRAELAQDRGAGYIPIVDGEVTEIRLSDTFAGYVGSLRDEREKERKSKAFLSAARWDEEGNLIDAPCVWPRGRMQGYGAYPNGEGFLIPPVVPIAGTFGADLSRGHVVKLPPIDAKNVPASRIFTQKMRAVMKTNNALGLEGTAFLWRLAGTTEWNEAPVLPRPGTGQPLFITEPGKYKPADGDPVDVQYITHLQWDWPSLDYAPIPTNGQRIEVIIPYVGPPTKDYPFRWEGEAGVLGASLYSNAGIRYDSTAMAALRTPLRVTVDSPANDVRDWMEKNFYAIQGAAPAIGTYGEIKPIRYALPPASEILVELNNENCQAIPGWSQTARDAINLVRVEYVREYPLKDNDDPFQERGTADGVAYKDVAVEERSDVSIAMLGEQRVEFKPVTIRSLGREDGSALGEATNEVGHQLARERARQLLDRFVLGGQHYVNTVSRDDPAVDSLRPGDWCIDATSWKPEYSTGLRGANRLVQVVSRKDVNSAWAVLTLDDAGPANQPLTQPTLGTPVTTATRAISVPVTAVPAGAEAAVYYGLSDTVPGNLSPLWTFLGRTAVPATLETPPQPAGAVVWVRARSEGEGRRPSAYTNAQQATAFGEPILTDVSAEVDEATGLVTVYWTRNEYAVGVRVRWTIAGVSTSADYAGVAGGASPFSLLAGQSASISVMPFTGFSGGAATGTAGFGRVLNVARADDGTANSLLDFGIYSEDDTSRTYSWVRGPRARFVMLGMQTFPVPVPDDPWAIVRASAQPMDPSVSTLTVPLPDEGFVTYVHLEPRSTTLEKGIIEHRILYPRVRVPALDDETGELASEAVNHWRQFSPAHRPFEWAANESLLDALPGEDGQRAYASAEGTVWKWEDGGWVPDPDTPINVYAAAIGAGSIRTVYLNAEVADFIDSRAATITDDAVSAYGGQVIRLPTQPSTRTGGAPLVAGDWWLDTDDGNAPWQYTGSAWVRAYTRIDGGSIVTGTVDAARLNITGAATFGPGYDPSTKETPAGAQAKVDTLANQLGDLAYADLVEAAKLGTTIIQGGYIKTELLSAEVIRALVASFGSLSAVQAVLGEVVTGLVRNADSTRWLDTAGTTVDFLRHEKLALKQDGGAEFTGTVKLSQDTDNAVEFYNSVGAFIGRVRATSTLDAALNTVNAVATEMSDGSAVRVVKWPTLLRVEFATSPDGGAPASISYEPSTGKLYVQGATVVIDGNLSILGGTVSVGAPDSGGAGYRTLRIPN